MTTMKMMKSHFKENMETTLLEEGEITSASDAEILKVSSLADGETLLKLRRRNRS